jgi:hypothetical protein
MVHHGKIVPPPAHESEPWPIVKVIGDARTGSRFIEPGNRLLWNRQESRIQWDRSTQEVRNARSQRS